MSTKILLTLLSLTIFAHVSLAICPSGSFESYDKQKCYHFIADQLQYFNDAESYCNGLGTGGHLASISDVFENALIMNTLKNETDAPRLYLGGYTSAEFVKKSIRSLKNRQGMKPFMTWTWTDGSWFAYDNWAPGQGNEMKAGQLTTFCPQDGKWYNDDGTLPFLCETTNK